MVENASVVEVRKSELHDVQLTLVPSQPLAEGQLRLAIDSFGITANNITYAVFGEMMSYWNFFPAPSGAEFGVVPVWGFASVAESRVDGIDEGERIYGYLPMATELIVEPARVTPSSFLDSSPHRSELPVTYNSYTRCAGDPAYDPEAEDERMLLQPLFFTSFLIDDFLEASEFFGADQVIATSASSKTGFGTAHLLSKRGSVRVIGLTSASNREFVESLGCYHAVFAYDEIDSLPSGPTILIDFAGNQKVVKAVHEHYGDDLKHSAAIGGTHWDADRPERAPLPGAKPEFFFAPTRVQARAKDWGMAELQRRLGVEWDEFLPKASAWLSVEHNAGIGQAVEVYAAVLSGEAPPSVAQVIQVDT